MQHCGSLQNRGPWLKAAYECSNYCGSLKNQGPTRLIESQRPKDALKRPPGWAGLRNCVWRCDTELGKANKNRDYRHQDVLGLNAEIEELEAHKAKLLIQKDELTADIAELTSL